MGDEAPKVAAEAASVAVIERGLIFLLEGGTDRRSTLPLVYMRDSGVNMELQKNGLAAIDAPNLVIRLNEGFANAFRSLSREQAEGDFKADYGTRLLALFTDIPDHSEVFVTTEEISSRGSGPAGAKTRLVLTSEDGSGDLGEARQCGWLNCARGKVALTRLERADNCAMAVWEWIDDSLRDYSEEIRFGVVVSAAPGGAGPGIARVQCGLAPFSDVTAADATAPTPRFLNVTSEAEAFAFLG